MDTAIDTARLDALDWRLLNDYQRALPLVTNPFAAMANRLGTTEAEVLRRLARLQGLGAIGRVGAVLAPRRLGASTLAALAVPEADLERMAAQVSCFEEVNHNYQREHRYNLWFVVTAPSAERLTAVLTAITESTGLTPLVLPLEREYFIDLGFPLEAP